MGHNSGMGRSWLLPTMLVMFWAGCSPPPESPRPPSKGKVAASQATDRRTPDAKPADRPLVSRFNLPLEIHIEAPEVPPEIERPSKPIEQK